jgi:hypothetical protein
MADIVTREQFIDECPPELKKRIDDFFVFYSQKKKSTVFSGPSESGKKYYKNDSAKYENKKNNMNSFKKPFEKKTSPYEQSLVDFKGILGKINENNQDSIWKEFLGLHLETYVVSGDGDEWASVSNNGRKTTEPAVDHSKELSQILYQYSRSCSMYLQQYIELAVRLHGSKELSVFSNHYVDLVVADLEKAKVDDKEFNVLTHSICCELFNNELITNKRFVDSCILNVYNHVVDNLTCGKSNDENMEILIQNITKCGEDIHEMDELEEVMDALNSWKDNKTFTGKIHYNLIDLIEKIQNWE